MDRYYTNPFSRLLKSRIKNPDEIVSSGLDRFPSFMKFNMPSHVKGRFIPSKNEMHFNPIHTDEDVIKHEARHAGIRQLLRDYGVSGRNKKFHPAYLPDLMSSIPKPNPPYNKHQVRALKNRDLEKMSGLLGYRGNPNSDTMFNLGEYIDNGQGKYTYSLDDDRMLAGVIPTPKSLYEQMEDKALKSLGAGVRRVRPDMDFEHSIIYNLKPKASGANPNSDAPSINSIFQNHRELRARDIYNKLLDLRERKQEGRFSDNASGMQNVKNTNIAPYNTKFLEEKEDPVNWYDNVHSFLSPQTSSGIIDYQPDNQQQNQQQSQQPIAPQIPNTPVSPNPHIDPPLVPDEIIIPVPDTKETSGPWYGGGGGYFVRSNAAYNDAGERVYHPLGGYWQYDGNHPNIKAANEEARNWTNTGVYRTQEYTYDGIPLTLDPEANSGQGAYVQPEGSYNGYSNYDAYLANTK